MAGTKQMVYRLSYEEVRPEKRYSTLTREGHLSISF